MPGTHLLVVDPQNDFVLGREDGAALSVPGARGDMDRLAAFVDESADRLGAITVTLDSHRQMQVFHALFWLGRDGNEPAPFTRITAGDVAAGRWTPRIPALRERALSYVAALEAGNRHALVIWPFHCLIGAWGALVYPPLHRALLEWERRVAGAVEYVAKGSNIGTEHYSAVQAEVPDPDDPGTQLNGGLIDRLAGADLVLVGGEALDYCVFHTVKDIVDAGPPGLARKIRVLEDCTSAIDAAAPARVREELGRLGVGFVATAGALRPAT